MMTSFYYDWELEKAKTVSDNDLNELLQKVRAIDDKYYLLERTHLTRKKWFRKQKEVKLYTILYALSYPECQVINFCQDHDWTINSSVTKSYIYTILQGFLNGYATKINS